MKREEKKKLMDEGERVEFRLVLGHFVSELAEREMRESGEKKGDEEKKKKKSLGLRPISVYIYI